MIYTELKNFDEIKKFLDCKDGIFLLGCNGCAEACETGGAKVLEMMKEKIEQEGKKITGSANIDFLCSKDLIIKRLKRHIKEIRESSAILVFSCGIGVQAVSNVVNKPVYPATDTISFGGFQGVWPGEERCAQCGTCYLGITGGICPITACTKELVNGPCGGTNDGKCEIDSEKDCGWALIYDRLKKIGKLDFLKEFQKPRNFRKMEPTGEIKKTVFFAIDKEEK